MALQITPATEARIDAVARERYHRLLQRAAEMRLMTDRDYWRSDGCVIWEPAAPGVCNVVTVDGCSCREFRLFQSCPHHALMIEMTGKAVA